MTITPNDMRAELSYAYLHAVATRAGFICESAGRLTDGTGVDAVVRVHERLAPNSIFVDFPVDIQLKATTRAPLLHDEKYSFSLSIAHYNKLRVTETPTPKLLAVMYLPTDLEEWQSHSEENLVLRRCVYWVSLRGAPESDNESDQTVYIPKANCLSANVLRDLMTRFSRQEELLYG